MSSRTAARSATIGHQRTAWGAKQTGIIHSTSSSTPPTFGALRSETSPSMRIVIRVKAIVSIAVKPGVLAAGGAEIGRAACRDRGWSWGGGGAEEGQRQAWQPRDGRWR